MKSSSFPRMHTSFYVSNLEKTVAFYTKFFGQEPEKVRPFYAKYILNEPSLIISFIESPEKVNANFGHVGIQVETQDEMYRRFFDAKTKGLELVEEIGVSCCYAKQDKFWVSDPDGIEWEIYYFHEDAEFNDPRYEFKEADTEGGAACGCTPKDNAENAKKPMFELPLATTSCC
jgi:catechol 2,3-dioxygenase-like lactoylglutathione lyase family enzyme